MRRPNTEKSTKPKHKWRRLVIAALVLAAAAILGLLVRALVTVPQVPVS